jgi:hypothetical protein
VAALALIDTGPDPDAFIPQGLLSLLLLAPLPGRLRALGATSRASLSSLGQRAFLPGSPRWACRWW